MTNQVIPEAALTITEFLEARITEDEVAATLRECHREDCGWIPNESGYSYPCDCGLPERMAAECAAKRAIIAAHPPYYADPDYDRSDVLCGACGLEPEEECSPPGAVEYPCPTLKALAAVYAGHPDYRREWAT